MNLNHFQDIYTIIDDRADIECADFTEAIAFELEEYLLKKLDSRLSLWRNRKAMNNTQPGKKACQMIINELEDIRKEICGDEKTKLE